MVWLLIIAFWAACTTAAACGAALSWRFLKNRFRRQLDAAEAKWHMLHQQDNPGTIIENVSVGWLNLLLQSLWAPVVEKHLAGLTTELLHKVFAEVLVKGSNNAPWKYLSSIGVEELSFGLVPPTFQVAQAKYDPTASMLTISTDVRFTSSSAQAVLLVTSKAVGLIAPVTVRLEVTHIKLRGRLRLGLQLSQEPPGIQGVYYSFTAPPHLDVAVGPLGLPLPAIIPGVDNALRGVLSKLLSKRLVEPQRRYVDVHRIYLNKHITRTGGPGGLLRVVVLGASNLFEVTQPPATSPAASPHPADDAAKAKGKASSKAAPSSSSGASRLSSYCEVRFGQLLLRTPITHHCSTTDASWNWQFSLALPYELSAWPAAGGGCAAAGGRGSSGAAVVSPSTGAPGSSGAARRSSAADSELADVLSLVVYDAQTVGQPVPLGKTKVSLCPLQLRPNGAARSLVLPLHKARCRSANVQLTVQWLKSTRPVQKQQQPARQALGQRAPQVQQQQQQEGGDLGPWDVPQLQQLVRDGGVEAADMRRSAVVPSSKGVSWQDKTQLRVRSAATAAMESLRHFKPSSSAPNFSYVAETGDSVEELAVAAAKSGGSGIPASDERARGPWGTGIANSSDDAPSSAAASAEDTMHGTQQQSIPHGGTLAAASGVQEPDEPEKDAKQSVAAHAARAVQGSPAGASASSSSTSTDSPAAVAGGAAAAGAHTAAANDGSSWLAALGTWLWPGSSPQAAAAAVNAAAAAVNAAAAAIAAEPQAGAEPFGSSPWSSGPSAAVMGDDGGPGSWANLHSQEDGGGVGTSGSSPLVLLSHVVHMQRQMDLQRAQLEELHKQLAHTNSSYHRLKQVCRQRGRSALLQGARFLLRKADGSTQHVLLYLAQASSSSRGGQPPSRLGRQQPPLADHGYTLIIAALPETRREARMAFRRMAAGAGEGSMVQGAGIFAAGDGTSQAARASSAGSVGGVPVGASSSATATGPRLSAFGSVGAGLRLRLQRGTLLQMGYESGRLPRTALQLLKAVPAGQLVGVVRGNSHSTASAVGSGPGDAAAAAACGAESAGCFTLMVQEDSSAYVTAITLQLPTAGNGRSLDEWILAVRDVAAAVDVAAAAMPAGTAAGSTPMAVAASSTGHAACAVAQQQGPPGHAGRDSTAGDSSVVQGLRGPTGAAAGAVELQGTGQQQHQQAVQHAADGTAPGVSALDTGTAVRTASNTQQVLEARDWLLPAAAAATPKPWPVNSPASGGGADPDTSSSGDDDDDDSSDGSGGI